jgi:hypothetical protein
MERTGLTIRQCQSPVVDTILSQFAQIPPTHNISFGSNLLFSQLFFGLVCDNFRGLLHKTVRINLISPTRIRYQFTIKLSNVTVQLHVFTTPIRTRWRYAIGFISRPLEPRGENPGTQRIRDLLGPSRSRRCKKQNFCSSPKSNPDSNPYLSYYTD